MTLTNDLLPKPAGRAVLVIRDSRAVRHCVPLARGQIRERHPGSGFLAMIILLQKPVQGVIFEFSNSTDCQRVNAYREIPWRPHSLIEESHH